LKDNGRAAEAAFAASNPRAENEPFALERILGTSDLMGVSFLQAGLNVARTVGRIWVGISGGRPLGSQPDSSSHRGCS